MKKTCFVVMGFGVKTDFETGRKYDLDMTYQNIIKPAVEAAGVSCVRADEIVHAGMIDKPMYDQIFRADLVVADISTGNRNAIYELGVRHALRPHTTIVIAEDSNDKIPFDLNHIVIRKYRHLGEDIGVKEARRFSGELTDAVQRLLAAEPSADSPVYTFIPDLQRPELQAASEARAAAVAPPPPAETHRALMELAREAQKASRFEEARQLLSSVLAVMENQAPNRTPDPTLLQQLALVTYKSKLPTPIEALRAACEILKKLSPETSNDPETLGLWGAVHKRLWQLTSSRESLDCSVRAHERGFYLRQDYYNGINLAFLLNERSLVQADLNEANTDFFLARRVREEVIGLCNVWQNANPRGSGQLEGARYWVFATLAEAAAGLGDEPTCQKWLQESYALKPDPWMIESTQTQLATLRRLLGDAAAKGRPLHAPLISANLLS
jgi:hypothetical protein